MTVLIRAIAFANGAVCPHAGQYLKTADFEAHDGRGFMTFTADPNTAMEFVDAAAALKLYHTRSRIRPTRPDGRPNRPLTALTIEIEKAPA